MNSKLPLTDVYPKSLNPPSQAAADNDTATVATDKSIPRINGYEITEEVGRGGMGVVYRAIHNASGRVVALKTILSSPRQLETRLRRFRTEAAVERLMHHPNIVEVVEVGEQDGCMYIAMEFVDGPDLAKKLAGGPLPVKEAIRLAADIAAAVQHLHDASVIHRDLKPANILLAPDGTAKIVDFGLAKLHDPACPDHEQTASGIMIGTLGYMPPEQLFGSADKDAPTVDIYGIGCLLYEMLTGQPPLRAKNFAEAVRMAEFAEPVPPRDLVPNLEAAIDAICMKCLSKEPADRYASARELQHDLSSHLSGQSMRGRAGQLLRHWAKALDRNPHADEYKSWSKLLVWLAVVNLVTQTTLYICCATGQPLYFGPILRAAQLTVMWGILWRFGGFAPRSASVGQRQVAGICVGFLLACNACALGHWLREDQFVDPAMYIEWSTLSGFLLVTFGRLFWGWFYLVACGFFALAVLTSPLGLGALLVFGLLWAIALLAAANRVGKKYRLTVAADLQ